MTLVPSELANNLMEDPINKPFREWRDYAGDAFEEGWRGILPVVEECDVASNLYVSDKEVCESLRETLKV
jgi:hypothetical protein